LKKVVFILVLILLFGSVSTQAFTTANIRPGYNTLLYNVMVGSVTGDLGIKALRIGIDAGLTHTVGLEGTISYRGDLVNLVDLGAKFRVTERGPMDVAFKLGFHGAPVSDWRVSLGFQIDQELTSFLTGHAGASISFGDEGLSWKFIRYFLGVDYSITTSAGLQLGVFKNIRDSNLGSIMLGLRTRF